MDEQQKMMTEHEAAEYLRVSVSTLQKWRCHCKGPAYSKFGSNVRYLFSDLEAYRVETRVVPGSMG